MPQSSHMTCTHAAWVVRTIHVRLQPKQLSTCLSYRRNLQWRLPQRARRFLCTAQAKPNDVAIGTGRIWLPTPDSTVALGALLGRDARTSDVLLLHGELGAGKTALARGYIQAARQNDSIEVTSPTYLLTNTYPPNKEEGVSCVPTIYHMDLWRLEDATRRSIVDFEKVFAQSISLIEWPDRLHGNIPKDRLDIELEYPPKMTSEIDESDPWGFGSGDADDISSSRAGRFASLVPHGDSWTTRVRNIHNCMDTDSDGNFVIKEK